VFIVVRRGDAFLVVHRSPENGGFWHGIAGGVEAGESSAEAAVRELREETGLVAVPVALDAGFEYDGITVSCFLVEAPPGWEPSLDHEHDDYRWCSLDEADSLLYWPEPRELLRKL
jgi:dATP pyrophosphohydrolase